MKEFDVNLVKMKQTRSFNQKENTKTRELKKREWTEVLQNGEYIIHMIEAQSVILKVTKSPATCYERGEQQILSFWRMDLLILKDLYP
jgi:hypothetical protein